MNLKEFISHRQYCPVCDTRLITEFHSKRKQVVRIEEHRLLVFFTLDGKKGGQKPYTTAYSFDLIDPSFHVEFYSKDRSSRYDTVNDFLRNRFLELHKNLKQFQFARRCSFCRQYKYSTDKFQLDLRAPLLPSLEICSEDFGLIDTVEHGKCRIYRLHNLYEENKSTLTFWKGHPSDANIDLTVPMRSTELKLSLIPFVSKEITTQRLNNLIIFT